MSIYMNSVINNMLSMNSNRQLGIVTNRKAKTTEKLSSGYKINRSADNAAGLAISEKMRRQIRGLTQASQNMQDGVSLCQVADGWLNEVHDMLHRINELAVKSSNGTMTPADREYTDKEVQSLMNEMERIFDTADFNEIPLFHQPYVPTVRAIPEVTDTQVFHTGTSEAPGGLEFNNVRYNIKELQNIGLNIDDNGVAKGDISNFEFELNDGELVSLNLSKDDNLDNISRNYEWKAKDDGIYINNKLATTWSGLTYNGVAGLSDTSHFQPGEYSFSYNGMEISFNIDDREADKEKVMFSINGDEITKPVNWTVSALSSSSRSIAPLTGSVTDQITAANKDDIFDEYKLSANADGLAIYNVTDDAYSNRIAWKDIPLSSGDKSIADWGKTVNSNTEVKFDNDSVFRVQTAYKDVNFDFSFKLSQVSSLEEVISKLDGKDFIGPLQAPAKLTVSGSNSSKVRLGSASITSESDKINAFRLQKKYGRSFSTPDNSTDTLTGSITWTKNVIQGETEPAYGNNFYSNSLTISENVLSTNPETTSDGGTYYIRGTVPMTDDEGNPLIDSYGNQIPKTVYYEVKKTQHNMTQNMEGTRRVFFDEKYRVTGTASLGSQQASNSIDITMPFYRTNKYTYDKNYYYNTYELIDPVGKTTEEMGVSYNDISGKILNYLDLNTVSSNPDKKYNYQTTYSNWNKTETGTKVSDTYANDQYTVNVDLPGLTNYDSAANISVRLKASELVAMTNGEQQSANLLFQATGKAQRTLLPVQSSHHLTSERDFTQIKLNVPKKRLDIQAGAEAGQHIRMEWDALNLTLIGMGATNTRTVESSQRAIVETKNALNIISENRSTFGAYQNRMEHAIRMTDNVVENTTYSESQIRDTDMSKAMMELAKDNILEQAGATILAQANQSRQGILNLLQ